MDIEKIKQEARKSLSKNRKLAKQKHGQKHGAVDVLIAEQFFSHNFFANLDWHGKFVSGYLPIGSEIDILPLLSDLRVRGAEILLPAIIAKDQPLQFRTWQEGDELIEESFGTKAPAEGAGVHLPDIILSPLLGFDVACYRLGYGGGFYDRSLCAIREKKPVIAIGFGYDEQELANVPRGEHDMRLNGVVTPSNFYLGDDF